MSNEDELGLPGPVQAELTRLRAEREVFTQRQERLDVQLREAELEIQEVAKHRDALLRQAADTGDLPARAAKADALADDLAVVQAERDTLRGELTDGRVERDRLRIQLLEAETLLASSTDPAFQLRDQQAQQRDEELAAAEQRAAEFARELAATQRTLSWRVTAPLRIVRRKVPRR